jgi:hypothetical protein
MFGVKISFQSATALDGITNFLQAKVERDEKGGSGVIQLIFGLIFLT